MSQLDKPGTLGFFQHTSLNTLKQALKDSRLVPSKQERNKKSFGPFYPNSHP